MRLQIVMLLSLFSLAGSIAIPPHVRGEADEVIADYNTAAEMDARDTLEPRAYPHCLSYKECKGGWCHKGNCLDNVCKGANMCPKGFLCDGANCYKHLPPWTYDIP
ncbi:hypothetical protein BDV32DRAFT_154671 [Aspergillus pseudonomiae]|uniref:Uncharacterized protein n=1 Tax=Aspergillus pseudonomiae TaxID=1506151 RepID=A0A5N7CWD9_9EURO|nr:uncharacterized protein BDV37DRAFT_276079 [Aspergillus pseudonomiae]KAB8255008.1 hypothetical protein BDV32DRAFT_154671 [Aspergillus pseudonomiae]KAE8398494.1 hypothetical protein BDV37DRAFT_276079 [Aspergillus pseudonomiae]